MAVGRRSTEQQLQEAAIFIGTMLGVLPVDAPARGLAATMALVAEAVAASSSLDAGYEPQQEERGCCRFFCSCPS